MNKQRNKAIITWGIISVAFILFVIFVYLPYADKQSETTKFADALIASPKLREPVKEIPPFQFTNQMGRIITEKDVQGKVYVADFFFTSCEAACPMMSTQLTRVQNAIDDTASFRILSYSLDPENDSVPVLKSFARKFKANSNVWFLLTGDKEEIYMLGEQGYLQTVLNDQKSFMNHSQKFILVDQNRMIRGFYNGLDSAEVDLLIQDIRFLLYKKDDRL